MLIQNSGLGYGYHKITSIDTIEDAKKHHTQMEFGILKLQPHQTWRLTKPLEKAILVMQGKMTLYWKTQSYHVHRTSFFDENPTVLLVPSEIEVEIKTNQQDAELCIVQTTNKVQYESKLFSADKCLTEQFGKGTLRETSTRDVRTIFDKNNMPESNLVLGEVINYPGKWSSYPPHGHNQPEIYYYRFNPDQGFGFAMDGKDKAHIVRNGDTLIILDGVPHSQTAAPGYAMYYIWAIRHLEGDPYGPQDPRKFLPEHTWVMDPQNESKIWPPTQSSN